MTCEVSWAYISSRGFANLTATPSTTDGFTETSAKSAAASLTPNLGPDAALRSSSSTSAGQSNQFRSSILEASSRSVFVVPTPTLGPSVTDISCDGSVSNLNPALTTSSGSSVSSVIPADTTVLTSMAAISSGDNSLALTGTEVGLTSMTGIQPSVSVGSSRSTDASPRPDLNQLNTTMSLSPSSVDALQLAVFLKNLAASVFNTNRIVAKRSSKSRRATAFNNLIAEIAIVSRTTSIPC
jgi:hypothetical protein